MAQINTYTHTRRKILTEGDIDERQTDRKSKGKKKELIRNIS